MGLWDLPNNETDAVNFFQGYGILPKNRECSNSHQMKLYICEEKVVWKCNVSSCRQTVGMRVKNWFEGTRITFTTAVRFIYCWSKELTSIKFGEEEIKMADKTVIDWNNYLREICVTEMEKEDKKKIGGPGCIVEINESMFAKRKINCGGMCPPQWIFGGICWETNETFLVTIPNKNASTLMNEIDKHIEEGSTIYSGSWKDFEIDELKVSSDTYDKVNHKYEFVDSETGAQMYLQGSGKWRNKKRRGTAKHKLPSYLAEFIWRQTQAKKENNCFDAILKAIAIQFPPEIQKS